MRLATVSLQSSKLLSPSLASIGVRVIGFSSSFLEAPIIGSEPPAGTNLVDGALAQQRGAQPSRAMFG
jgi:hypothetical protein